MPIGLALIRVLSRLPPQLGLKVGGFIGHVLFHVAKNRRMVCERNIAACFPDRQNKARHDLVKSCFIENGKGLVETAWAWHRPLNFVRDRMHVEGSEHIERAQSEGRGILLLCPHYSMLDLVAPLVYQVFGDFVITYRPNDNPEFNTAVCAGRERYARLIDVRAIRDMARALKAGELMWFGPDQDMGTKGSVFAEFFGRPASTVTTPARLARMSGACTVFLDLHRDGEIYKLKFRPMGKTYPVVDEVANARALNAYIEEALQPRPAQYMWMHKRFKTNPDLTRQTLYQDHSPNS